MVRKINYITTSDLLASSVRFSMKYERSCNVKSYLLDFLLIECLSPARKARKRHKIEVFQELIEIRIILIPYVVLSICRVVRT